MNSTPAIDFLKQVEQQRQHNPEFAAFLAEYNLTDEQLLLPKNQYELKRYWQSWTIFTTKCKPKPDLSHCQQLPRGQRFKLNYEFGYIYLSLIPCPCTLKAQKANKDQNRYWIWDLPHSDQELKLNDVYQSAERATLLKLLLVQFKALTNHQSLPKGLYIHGPMGTGKTFLTKIIANFFAHHNQSVAFVETSNLIRDLKNKMEVKGYIGQVTDQLKTVDLLILDDFGSEKPSEWVRDEIWFPLLNYRMNHNKITYFTSNFDLTQLEKHYTVADSHLNRNVTAKMKSSRLIERIKALTTSIKLTGVNYRYKK